MNHASTMYDTDGLRRYFSNVFAVMGVGLMLTGIITMWISHSPGVMASLFNLHTTTVDGKTVQEFGASAWWWTASIIELLLVVAMSWGSMARSMSVGALLILFSVYAALNGVTLAPVIYAYTDASVAQIFFITGATFGGAAFWGHTTKINLRPFSAFFLYALIGLLIVLVINIFFSSPAMDFMVSGVAVLLFAALTAYDVQKLTEFYEESSDDSIPRLVVYGALTFYLDFINMFLHLLRLFGVKKD